MRISTPRKSAHTSHIPNAVLKENPGISVVHIDGYLNE